MKLFFSSLLFLFCVNTIANENIKMPAKAEVFQLSTFPCFGACPQYDFYVFSDNSYLFIGNKFVNHLGFYKGQFTQNEYQSLLNILKKFDFSNFQDHYRGGDKQCTQMMTDHPSIELKLQSTELNKEIHHYLGCKGFEKEIPLLQLEEKIKTLLHISSFIKTNDNPT
ncbi:MAG: hypothetical protein COW84_01845 [Gammaproteobacteria bacterium CG22_combo_CG10-13_8_21_14_all_40_8]|nr:MAG: hypothetical protein COW84_01845 [Gammaproteobacteria bacterium CG22_combo_CG10-13_8_21_14_all_40_8]